MPQSRARRCCDLGHCTNTYQWGSMRTQVILPWRSSPVMEKGHHSHGSDHLYFCLLRAYSSFVNSSDCSSKCSHLKINGSDEKGGVFNTNEREDRASCDEASCGHAETKLLPPATGSGNSSTSIFFS